MDDFLFFSLSWDPEKFEIHVLETSEKQAFLNTFLFENQFLVGIYRFGTVSQAQMSQKLILDSFYKFCIFPGDFGKFPFFFTELGPREV